MYSYSNGCHYKYDTGYNYDMANDQKQFSQLNASNCNSSITYEMIL